MGLLDNFDSSQMFGGGGPGDPLIALGMGLLSQRGVGRGLAQGMQNVATMSEQAQKRQQEEARSKLLAAQTAKALQPTYQFHTDPNTGIVSALNPQNPNAGLTPLPGQTATQAWHWAQPNELPADYKGPPVAVGKNGPIYPPAGTNVNIDQKKETAFATGAGGKLAERFSGLSGEGDTAREDLAMLGHLRNVLAETGGGAWPALQGVLAQHGIKLGDNVGAVEAFNSIIDKLTPQQRVPGSGTSSNLDVSMLKNALPKLINTPGGNKIILDTLEGLANYKVNRAAVAERALAGEITPQDAMKQLRELPNPLAQFNPNPQTTAPTSAPASPSAPALGKPSGKMQPIPQDILSEARHALQVAPHMKVEIMNRLMKAGYDPSGL